MEQIHGLKALEDYPQLTTYDGIDFLRGMSAPNYSIVLTLRSLKR
jgi:hypothetical protein